MKKRNVLSSLVILLTLFMALPEAGAQTTHDISKEIQQAGPFMPADTFVLTLIYPQDLYDQVVGKHINTIVTQKDREKLQKDVTDFLISRLGYNPLLTQAGFLFATPLGSNGFLLKGEFNLAETGHSKFETIEGKKILIHKDPDIYTMPLEDYGVALFFNKKSVIRYIKNNLSQPKVEDRKNLKLFSEALSGNNEAWFAAVGDIQTLRPVWEEELKTPPPDYISAVIKGDAITLTVKGDAQSLDALLAFLELGKTQVRQVLADSMAKLEQAPLFVGLGLVIANSLTEPFMLEFTPKREGDKLFITLDMETNGIIAMTGVLAAIAVPAFIKYIKRSKTSEAHMRLNMIAEGALAFYQMEQYTNEGEPIPNEQRTFPVTCNKIIWTHDQTPSGNKGAPTADFSAQVWGNLSFSLSEPSYYRYGYKDNCQKGKLAGFEVIAEGDLDGDGIYSTFKRMGTITDDYPNISGVIIENELE